MVHVEHGEIVAHTGGNDHIISGLRCADRTLKGLLNHCPLAAAPIKGGQCIADNTLDKEIIRIGELQSRLRLFASQRFTTNPRLCRTQCRNFRQ